VEQEGELVADTRVTTIRQPADQAEALEFVARVEGVSTAELIRTAVDKLLADRRADPAFQARLQERMAADQHILQRLAE
jgi:hypothetical protein